MKLSIVFTWGFQWTNTEGICACIMTVLLLVKLSVGYMNTFKIIPIFVNSKYQGKPNIINFKFNNLIINYSGFKH